MGPSLTSSQEVGVSIVTTSDPAGIDDTNTELDTLTDALGTTSDAADAANTSFTTLSGTVDDATTSVTAFGDAADEYVAEAGVVNEANEAMIASYGEVADAAITSGAAQDSALASVDASKSFTLGGFTAAATNPYVVAAAVTAIGVAEFVKEAATFQKAIIQLYTTAGETVPLQQLETGIEQISDLTGEATSQLTSGLYYVSSAGFTAASGLDVLKAAAEGASAENADLTMVANALTTVLVDFKAPASDATMYMNEMLTAVSRGKTTLQDLSGALSTVLPIANSVGLSFAQIGGAMATLTAGGVSTEQAAQDLHAVISTLIAPTQAQVTAMQQMGLNSVELSKNLGTEGLTGTLQEMFNAIEAHMGPDGLVIQNAMKNATLATQDMNTMLKQSPPELQALENQLLNGTISFASFRTAVQALPEGLTNLGKEFEKTYNDTTSFNNALVAGVNASPTFAAELKAMTGQVNAMNAVLLLTGGHMPTFKANVEAIGKSSKDAGSNINEWNTYTKGLDAQFKIFTANIHNLTLDIGNALLPKVTELFEVLNTGAGYVENVAHALGDVHDFMMKLDADASNSKLGSFLKTLQDDTVKSSILTTVLSHFAGGVTNFGGGMALVGEEGPELVYLPTGSSVLPNTETNQMLNGGGGSMGGSGGNTTTHTVTIGQVNLTTAAAVTAFIKQIDLDSIAVGNGLTPSRGVS